MAIREAKLKNGIEAVAIVTPNHVHYPRPPRNSCSRGIHVICDKPLTSNLADAKKLKKIADESDALFVLTHNYTGYPMVRQAREMIANGELGEIRVVQAEYPQDWLTEAIEQTRRSRRPGAPIRRSPARAARPAISAPMPITSPASSPASSSTSLAADLDSFVEGRRLDDNAHVMLRFKAKARRSRPRACSGAARWRPAMRTA